MSQKDPIKNFSLWTEEDEKLFENVEKSGFQEGCLVRNVFLVRKMVNLLFDEKGDLQKEILFQLVEEGKKNLFCLTAGRETDVPYRIHILNVLESLQDPLKQNYFKKITAPYRNPFVEQLIKETLDLEDDAKVGDLETKKAVLAAWMTYLRQNVGSCFATAPGILIQQEQGEQFLLDLNEMMNRGSIQRVFGGKEYAFPMSFSSGIGDLKRNVLLDQYTIEDLAKSPGILNALESISFFDQEKSQSDKEKELKDWIIQYVEKKKEEEMVLLDAESILNFILQTDYQVSKQMIQAYKVREAAFLSPSLFHIPPSYEKNQKNQGNVEKYLEVYQKAKNKFKRLSQNALLKTWEFTLASFAETKAKFTSWNLYSCLGFQMDQKGGIGPEIKRALEEKIQEENRETENFQIEYEAVFHQLKMVESRFQHASEDEQKWLKAEYQARKNEFYTLEEIRNRHHRKAKLLANFYEYLVDEYYRLFPEFFQEVFDPELRDLEQGPYDDSPAGFRLFFKHGRVKVSEWTKIQNRKEFIESLRTFFTLTEREITENEKIKEIEKEAIDVITAIISHIQTDEFLESAFFRMASVHGISLPKDPLKNLEKLPITPWAYISGGTMKNLVAAYFVREEGPEEKGKWVENDTELLVFLVDLLKEMPPKTTDLFRKNRDKSLLMHSPTHAFLLKPGFDLFYSLWNENSYTYTWIRDRHIFPGQRWVEDISLNRNKIDFILEKWKLFFPKSLQNYFLHVANPLYQTMNPIELRSHVITQMENNKNLQWMLGSLYFEEKIDSWLYEALPLFSYEEMEKKMKELIFSLSFLSEKEKKQTFMLYQKLESSFLKENFFTSSFLQDFCQTLLKEIFQSSYTEANIPFLVTEAAKKNGISSPLPILVADTNWAKDFFGFTINPGTGVFEFWRFDFLRRKASPMSFWRQWLNGSRQDLTWGVYTKPYEYTSHSTFSHPQLRRI